IRAAQHASALASAADVAAWRAAPPVPAAARPAAGPAITLAPLPASAAPEPIETVILRRGSARQFTLQPIAFDALSTILSSATRGIPTDCPGPPVTDLYLIVHAVDGLEPGTYVLDRGAGALHLLRSGRFRAEAGHLGLGQALPADAAVCVYWLADLEPELARH